MNEISGKIEVKEDKKPNLRECLHIYYLVLWMYYYVLYIHYNILYIYYYVCWFSLFNAYQLFLGYLMPFS